MVLCDYSPSLKKSDSDVLTNMNFLYTVHNTSKHFFVVFCDQEILQLNLSLLFGGQTLFLNVSLAFLYFNFLVEILIYY